MGYRKGDVSAADLRRVRSASIKTLTLDDDGSNGIG